MAGVSSGVHSVGELFADRRFGLTYYQREYAWSRADVRALLADLAREFDVADSVYYLGAIVYYREGPITFLIDGQQRVTTLNLLLLHLRRLLIEQELTTTQIDALVLPGAHRPGFALDVPEQAYLYESIRDGAVPKPRPEALESERHVAQRYVDLVADLPRELTGEWLAPFTEWLLSQVFVVGIEAGDREHGWRIFESTNDRGVRLGPLDLLKGFLLVNAGAGQEGLAEQWRAMVAGLSEVDEHAPAAFLRDLLVARYADLDDAGDVDRIRDAFHEWVREEAPRLELTGPADFVRLVREELPRLGARYAQLTQAALTYDPQWAPVFFNARNAIPYHLAAILAVASEVDTDEAFRTKALLVANYLDLLFVRRLVHSKIRDGADLAPDVLELIAALRSDPEAAYRLLSHRVSSMGDALPPPASFGLTGDNEDQVRYLLARMTSYVQASLELADEFPSYLEYRVTHLWGEEFEAHPYVGDKRTFAARRNRLPGLVLLPPGLPFDENSPYTEKVVSYRDQHLLAAVLHSDTHTDPTVAAWITATGLGDVVHPVKRYFVQDDMVDRELLVARLAARIWDPTALGLATSDPAAPNPVRAATPAMTAPPSATPTPPARTPAKKAPPAKVAKKATKKSRKAAKSTAHPMPARTPPTQAQTVRLLIEHGYVRADDRLLGHDRSRRPTGHVAILRADGTILLDDGSAAADLDAAGRLAQGTRACDGWSFWWVEQATGPTPLEAVRQSALNVGDI